MKHIAIRTVLAAATLAALLPGQSASQDQADQPGRGVARLSLMNGDVTVRRGDSGDWIAGAVNAPLLADDRIYAGPGARAEVQFDSFNRVRLAGETEIRLLEVEWQRYQIQVVRGTAAFSALKGSEAQVELTSPAAALRPLKPGLYRVTVQPDGDAVFSVRDGEAEIFTPAGTQRLKDNRSMLVRANPTGAAEFQMVAEVPLDTFDQFNQQRDKELQHTQAYQYVSRDVYGAEDLDGNGTWVYANPYGWVWQPYVAPGWAPYRYGRWAWADYYGWSWVSYDPWGWAPYHYGRWFSYGGRWCWYPGGMGGRHYWSPALVAWVGFGGAGWGVGIGVGGGWGGWGWVPLAPFEPCYRWWGSRYYAGYRGGGAYYNHGPQVVNNVNITNIYRNARVDGGVTVVDGNDFSRGAAGRAARMDQAQFGQASVVKGPVPVAPNRESLRWTEREVRASEVPRATANADRYYSRNQTARVERVPFETQRQSIEQYSRRASDTFAPRVEATGRTTALPAGRAESPAGRGSEVRGGEVRSLTNETPRGWRSTDTGAARTVDTGAGRSVETQSPRSVDTERSGGWRSFGDPGARTAEAAPSDAGRSSRTPVRSTEESGWRGFGTVPSRTVDTPRATSPRIESPRNEVQRTESPRSASSQGDASRSAAPRSDSPRIESPRTETPRSSEPPRMSEPSRSVAPRIESPRTETPRTETPRSSEPSRTRQDMGYSSMPRGGWAVQGGELRSSYGGGTPSTAVVPRIQAPSGGYGGATGGGAVSPNFGGGYRSLGTGSPSFGSGSSGIGSAPRMQAPSGSAAGAPRSGGGGGASSGGRGGGGGRSR